MSKDTVFVVGAGASYEAGLPTGHELKENISNILNSKIKRNSKINIDKTIYDAIALYTQENKTDIQEYISVAKHISEGLLLSISIDNFIDEHRDNNNEVPLCGKLAIAKSILDAERLSKLYIDNSNIYNKLDFSSLTKTWYISFFRLLTEKCDKNDLEKRLQSVRFIIFNYDRCVEHFLYHALLKKYYGMSKQEAAHLVNSIKIYHPYGHCGSLPLGQEVEARFGDFYDFGEKISPSRLLRVSENIKTFTEGANSKDRNEIQQTLKNADRVVFLGFGFHELNMDLIRPPISDGEVFSFECFATAFGFSNSDIKIISSQIKSLHTMKDRNQFVEGIPCNQLFSDFSKSLTF
jgi:hypothetical protein